MADSPQPESTPAPALKGRLLQWFANNPVLGVITSVATLISVPLSIYFFVASIRTRDLSFYVNPTKTTIVKSGQSSDLHVLYKGQSLSTDVTALQVAIWNAGKDSIRSEHVLSALVISTSPKVPILEARIRHVSRPVTEVRLDSGRLSEGLVLVSWKILEQHDGVIIQLIVAGSEKTSAKIGGVIEGQQSISVSDETTSKVEKTVWIVIGVCGMIFSSQLSRRWAEDNIQS